MATADKKLDISSTADKSETRIRVRGRLDGSISPSDRELAIATVSPGCRLIVDLEEMAGISAVGLRMLLQLSRSVWSVGGSIRVVNVPESLREMASAAGFARSLNQPVPLHRVEDFAPSRLRVDAYPTHEYQGYGLRAGRPMPFGATAVAGGINFSVFSRNATQCILTLYPVGGTTPLVEIPFPPEFRIGDVFAMTVFNLDIETIDYGFRMDGPSDGSHRNRFDRSKVLLDPAARAVNAGAQAHA